MTPLTTAIFICENGELEIKSAILAASLKNVYADRINLICSIPEPGPGKADITKETKLFLESLGVNIFHFTNPLTGKVAEMPPGLVYSNKLYCFPRDANIGRVIFMDSDIICLKSPENLNPEGTDFLACQAFRSLDINWKDLYLHHGIAEPSVRAISILDHVIAYPYFNSGLLILNGKMLGSLLTEWRQIFASVRTILTEDLHLNHSDQISLSLAIHKLRLTYEILPEIYNFPSGSKLIDKKTIFAHYHGPEAVLRDPALYGVLHELKILYPGLIQIASRFHMWSELFNSKRKRSHKYGRYKVNKRLRNIILPGR